MFVCFVSRFGGLNFRFPVLIAIDDYNDLWNPNLNFRNPESRRYVPEPLMTRELALASLFFNAHTDHKLVISFALSPPPSYSLKCCLLKLSLIFFWIRRMEHLLERQQKMHLHERCTRNCYIKKANIGFSYLHTLAMNLRQWLTITNEHHGFWRVRLTHSIQFNSIQFIVFICIHKYSFTFSHFRSYSAMSQLVRDYLYQLSSGFGRDLWKYTQAL
jgi:hypothetical protein